MQRVDRIAVVLAVLAVASAGLHADAAPSWKIDLQIVDAQGKTLARATNQAPNDAARLRHRHKYNPGDKIVVRGPKHMLFGPGVGLPAGVVYCPTGEFEFPVPTGKAARAYDTFASNRHTIYARPLAPWEFASFRNIAVNPADAPESKGLFPHVTTNSVCRNDPVFAARNAIDGFAKPDGHGPWPHQSWGPDMKEGLWLRIDFGRPVEVEGIGVTLRADVPHDRFFLGATIVFPDKSERKITFKPHGKRQWFSFPRKTVTWLEFRNFVLPKEKGWCAVTEVEVRGRDAMPYAKKATWRETVISQLHIWPAYVMARAMQDFPKDYEQLRLVADWVGQDKLDGPDFAQALRAAIGKIGEKGKTLLAKFDKLAPSDPQRVGIYLRACALRREMRLAKHADKIKRVVFTKHYDMGGSHYAYTEGQSDAQKERHFRPGSALCLLDVEGTRGKVRTLLEDPKGVIRDPDVSFDGKRILFAWKKSLDEDDYHLYEMTVADGKVRQITSGLGYADYEGAYLPNGDIIFNSTRCVQTVDCWWTEVSNLFTCDGDGRYLRRLSYDQVHTNFPTVTPDGRVIYTRWDYSDRGQIYPQGLFQMYPDGTAQTEVYGNNSWFPTSILHARAIPGSNKIVCIFSGHHTRQKGWLGLLDPDLGREENSGTQLIAPVRETPAVHIDQYAQHGDQFQYPYPLSETGYLVAFKPVGARNFAIYYMTIDGERELLASDPRISCNQPIPLAPRPVPHARPNLVDYRKTNAVMYLHDIYFGPGLKGVPRGTIQGLRVVALEYRAAGVGHNGNSGPAGGAMASTPVSIQGAWDVKRVLGTAKVYEDGSACFIVPPRTPIYFQALDASGHAVQTMRSWATLQPGERFSCVGCHESKSAAPHPRPVTHAMKAGPQELTPWHIGPRGFSFIRNVQPILDRHCVRCHYVKGGARPPAPKAQDIKPAFSLKGDQALDTGALRKWSDAYKALANRKVADWINIQSGPSMLPPYQAGAAKSKLIQMLKDGQGHPGGKVRLSQKEKDILACWIDLLVPYCGDYTEAMAEDQVARYRHFEAKRLAWKKQEGKNIDALIRDRLAKSKFKSPSTAKAP
ncbi:MAG: hypothetical protein GXP25_13110 [Planctomycetes bacterium]|nr:hypothetical protein [Planctomycetota bacterium]